MASHTDAALWSRLRPLFDEAAELPAPEHNEFVRRRCGGDPQLERRLNAMLLAHSRQGAVLDRSLPQRLMDRATLGAAPDRETPALPPAALIGDRYEVERELGAGGFGRVYLAKDSRLNGRHVAVKVLHPQSSAQQVLNREIAALSRVRHPSISTPIDSGITPQAMHYLVLDYVPGQSLRQALQHGPFSPARTWNIALALGSALQVAHDAGVWHLDLKPSNVLLRQDAGSAPSPVLVDFGIARSGGNVAAVSAGSLAYSAPEQLAGSPSSSSDQYSFALILLEMLTGRQPQPFDDGEAGLARLADVSPDLGPNLGPNLGKVLGRALSRKPEDRYPSIADFLTALRPQLAPAPRQSNNSFVLAAGLTLVAILAAAGIGWVHHGREKTSRNTDLDVLQQQIAAMSASGRLTSIAPQIPSDALLSVINNLQTRVDQGSRDPKLLSVLSNGLLELGMLHGHPSVRGLGRSEEGAALIRRSLDLAELLRKSDPHNLQWVFDSVGKHNALATLYLELGRLEDCRSTAEAGLALLGPEDPLPLSANTPALRRTDLRASLTMTLSRVPFQRRQFAECLRLRDRSVFWKRAVVAAFEAEARRTGSPSAIATLNSEKFDLSGRLSSHGYLLREMERYKEALQDYAESDQLTRNSLALDPQNMTVRWRHMRNLLEIGHIYTQLGSRARAREELRAAIEEMQALSAGSAMDVRAMRLLSLAHCYLAQARAGEPAAKLKPLLETALRLNAQAAAADPANAIIATETQMIREAARRAGILLPRLPPTQ